METVHKESDKARDEKIQQTCQDVALYLSDKISKLGPFELITDGSDIPVFAFKQKTEMNYTLYDLTERLRDRGWLIPAYSMPADREDLVVARIVVKEGFSHDMANLFLEDMERHLKYFASQPDRKPTKSGSSFHH